MNDDKIKEAFAIMCAELRCSVAENEKYFPTFKTAYLMGYAQAEKERRAREASYCAA